MPIREEEQFLKHFIADTEEEAIQLLEDYDTDITMLANKVSQLTGISNEDLKQEGIIGLARAKREFEESRSDNFRIFAIYKIKDAMREFVTMQGSNVRAPQYVKDALKLAEKLKALIGKEHFVEYSTLLDVWNMLDNIRITRPLAKDVESVKNSLENLADRSHTSVPQLLERAIFIPDFDVDIVDHKVDDLSDVLIARDEVSAIKNLLTKDEFDLLWLRFVEGKTVRELESHFGIKNSSIIARTEKLIDRLNRWRNDGKRNHEITKHTKEVRR